VRASSSEKLEVIRLVEDSALSVTRTLRELDVPRSTFYHWYKAYLEGGPESLEPKEPERQCFWNRIPEGEREKVVEEALARPELSARELAWHVTDTVGSYISESSVYRILKSFDLVTSPAFVLISAKDRFDRPTRRVHELWQTDFSYFKVVGWGWYYLLSVLDDYSRYIVSWRVFTGMGAEDVQELLDEAIAKTGVERVEVRHRPRLLSDNGSAFVSGALRTYLEERGLTHTRGKPYHPMTQGKIERFHRTLKNVVTLRNFHLPWELEREIAGFVRYYNQERVHEALDNLTPADVYEGRGREIQTARQRLKEQTLRRRRRINRGLPVRPEQRILPALYRNGVL
jgi:transposase InsO family protein